MGLILFLWCLIGFFINLICIKYSFDWVEGGDLILCFLTCWGWPIMLGITVLDSSGFLDKKIF